MYTTSIKMIVDTFLILYTINCISFVLKKDRIIIILFSKKKKKKIM